MRGAETAATRVEPAWAAESPAIPSVLLQWGRLDSEMNLGLGR